MSKESLILTQNLSTPTPLLYTYGMDSLSFILLVIVGLLLGAVVFLVYRFTQLESHLKANSKDQLLLQQVGQLTERLDKGLAESRQTLQEQVRSTAAIVRDVTERLTKLDATNQRVQEFAGQLQSLENILRNPKHRGILGEYFLETLLTQVFQPNQYKMQYSFQNGEIVDAVIFLRDQIIPIDAKFSLEKFNQISQETDAAKREQLEREFKADVKTRIDETAKYIRPEEKTTNFAFMYVPAEGIYYNLLISKVGTVEINTQDLIEYAFKKKVIIVSPVTFFAYLQTVLQGLKANQIEQSVHEILERIHVLGRHINVYEDYMKRLGTQLGTTVTTYNAAYKEFGKIDKDVYKLTKGEAGGTAELLQLEKPSIQDQE